MVSAFLDSIRVVHLVPADRELVLRTCLAGLGRGPESELVAGEVTT